MPTQYLWLGKETESILANDSKALLTSDQLQASKLTLCLQSFQPFDSMKRNVVAVDMMEDNLAHIKRSLIEAKLTDYVQLVNNAIR